MNQQRAPVQRGKRMTDSSNKPIDVKVARIGGGIGINLGAYTGLGKEGFIDCIYTALEHGGFTKASTVHFERNAVDEDGKPKVNWFQIRIGADECEFHGVKHDLNAVVERIKRYLGSKECRDTYGVRFNVS